MRVFNYCIATVQNRAACLPDAALAECAIRPAARDAFCAQTFQSVLYKHVDSVAKITYDPEYAENDRPVVSLEDGLDHPLYIRAAMKIAGHELGHYLDNLNRSTRASKEAASYGKTLPHTVGLPIAASFAVRSIWADKQTRRNFLRTAAKITTASWLIETASIVGHHQITETGERQADLIADMLVPEFTYADMEDDIHRCRKDGARSRPANTVQSRIAEYIDGHPPTVERMLASTANCQRFAKNAQYWTHLPPLPLGP